MGPDISYQVLGSFKEADIGELSQLIERSLGKELVGDYYQKTIPRWLVLAGEGDRYLGAAILEDITPDIGYVDKFVVDPSKQRNGIGGQLLDIVGDLSPKHILRAKAVNPHQGIYKKKGYFFEQSGEWVKYWKGLEGADLMVGSRYALSKPETLRPFGAPDNLSSSIYTSR